MDGSEQVEGLGLRLLRANSCTRIRKTVISFVKEIESAFEKRAIRETDDRELSSCLSSGYVLVQKLG
jgi:hypothetical protein